MVRLASIMLEEGERVYNLKTELDEQFESIFVLKLFGASEFQQRRGSVDVTRPFLNIPRRSTRDNLHSIS